MPAVAGLGIKTKESRNGQRRRKTLRKTRRRNFSADEHSRKRAPFAAILTCFKYPSTLSACAPIKREFSIKCRNPRKRTCQQLFVKIKYANCAQTNRPRPRHTPRPFASADNRNAIARIAKKEISKNSALFFKASGALLNTSYCSKSLNPDSPSIGLRIFRQKLRRPLRIQIHRLRRRGQFEPA